MNQAEWLRVKVCSFAGFSTGSRNPTVKSTTCYMCERPGTSREHVPPRCLFPELKDAGENLRKNLITVRSCDEHNSEKSRDDEFLMVSLAGIIGNNSIGYHHKFTKVNRAIYRSSFSLLNLAIKNQEWSVIEFGPNKFLDVVWGTPDYERLLCCFDRVARGIHLAHFGRKFRGRSRTLLGYLPQESQNPAELQRLVRDKVAAELQGKPRVGSNPKVFNYQFTEPDRFGLYLAHLQFYGGLDVYAALIPEDSKAPENFAMQLINAGIPTTVIEGAERYTFNKLTL